MCLGGEVEPTGSYPCPEGHYCPPGSTEPLPAQAGYFVDSAAQQSQKPCYPGTFSNSTGTINCTLCPAGHECLAYGTIVPSPCLSGFFRTADGAVECEPCPYESSYNPVGATSKTQCYQPLITSANWPWYLIIVGSAIGLSVGLIILFVKFCHFRLTTPQFASTEAQTSMAIMPSTQTSGRATLARRRTLAFSDSVLPPTGGGTEDDDDDDFDAIFGDDAVAAEADKPARSRGTSQPPAPQKPTAGPKRLRELRRLESVRMSDIDLNMDSPYDRDDEDEAEAEPSRVAAIASPRRATLSSLAMKDDFSRRMSVMPMSVPGVTAGSPIAAPPAIKPLRQMPKIQSPSLDMADMERRDPRKLGAKLVIQPAQPQFSDDSDSEEESEGKSDRESDKHTGSDDEGDKK